MLRLIRPLAAVTLMLLCACQAPSESPAVIAGEARVPWELYGQLDDSRGRVYRLDAGASAVRIHVYRAGVLAARGHNHVVTARSLDGAVFVPARGTGEARFDLVIPVNELVVDDPSVRRSLGYTFASELDHQGRADTRANMLGAGVLDAEQFPVIAVASREIAGELPKLVVTVAVTLHGVTREHWVPVDVQVDPQRLVAQGALAIRQSDFGIEPFSALGGLLRVDDALMIEFRLVGEPD